jgi:hypothetical protein
LLENSVRLQSLRRLLEALAGHGVQPIVLKGAALLELLYPDPGARLLTDVDLLVARAELGVVHATMDRLGFGPVPGMDRQHRQDAQGVLVDLHHVFRIFEGRNLAELTVTHPPGPFGGPPWRAFEPHAMLVHLSAHLHGHRGDTGFMLRWLVDIGLAIRAWGDQIDRASLEDLFPDVRSQTQFDRMLGFFERDMGIAIPETLASRHPYPLRLPDVLRSRRLARWGLPKPRGWLRLAARLLGRRTSRDSPLPRPDDLIRWIPDLLR